MTVLLMTLLWIGLNIDNLTDEFSDPPPRAYFTYRKHQEGRNLPSAVSQLLCHE